MILGGPQKGRDRLWVGKEDNIDDSNAQRGDLILERETENQVYEGEIAHLSRENIALKDQLNRSLKELKEYQIKYPSAYMTLNDEEEDADPIWTISAESMGPLITAYDCRIRELQDGLKSQTQQLEILHEQFQDIVGENEKLRDNQLENLKNNAKGRGGGGGGGGNLEPFAPVNSEMMAEMNERVDILMSENALLLEQKNLLKSELEKYNDDLTKRTLELQEASVKTSNYSKEIQTLRAQLSQVDSDRGDVGARLLRQGELMGNMEREREDMMAQLVTAQKEKSQSDRMIQDLSKQLQGIISKSEEESLAYMRRTKTAEVRVRELHQQLQKKTAELNTSQEMSRKLRREYQATRTDAEGMLQVLSGLERQISDFTARETDFERRIKESREALESALTSKDQAIAREEHCRREVERLLLERKKQATDRQKDIDQAAEISLGRTQTYIKSIEKNLDNLTQANAQLKLDSEVAVKENRAGKANTENYQQLLDGERKSAYEEIKSLQDKLAAITIAKEEEIRRRMEVQELNKDMRATIDKMRSQMEHTALQVDSKEKSKEAELAALRSTIKDLTRQVSEKNRQLARKHSEIEEMRIDFDERVISLERKRQEDVSHLQRANMELEASLKDMQSSYSGDAHDSKLLIDQIKEKNVSALRYLEARLSEERDAAEDLTEKNRVLEESILVSQEERSQLVQLVEEARATIKDLQGQLDEAQSTIQDLMNHADSKVTIPPATVKSSAQAGGDSNQRQRVKIPQTDGDFGIEPSSPSLGGGDKDASFVDDYGDKDIETDESVEDF